VSSLQSRSLQEGRRLRFSARLLGMLEEGTPGAPCSLRCLLPRAGGGFGAGGGGRSSPEGREVGRVAAHVAAGRCGGQWKDRPRRPRVPDDRFQQLPHVRKSQRFHALQLPSGVKCQFAGRRALPFCLVDIGSQFLHPWHGCEDLHVLRGPAKPRSRDPSQSVGGTAATWLLPPEVPSLDQARMKAAAAQLVGRHDFCALSSSSGGEGSTTRQLIALDVGLLEQAEFGLLGASFDGGRVLIKDCQSCSSTAGAEEVRTPGLLLTRFRVQGRGFLKHMVRRIVGFLLQVGSGDLPPTRAFELLGPHRAEDLPQLRPPKAPAQGLWLERV
ncbi:truA, partial [Symbiodinium sp. CCMP2456]